MTDRDGQLDDDLRRVPLPGDLPASVRGERLFDDSAIDRLVGRVAVPPGLAERVRRCVEQGTPATGVVDLSRFAAGRPGEQPAAATETPAATTAHTQTALVAAGKLPVGRWRRGLNRALKVAREAGTVAAALALTLLVAAVGMEVSRHLGGPPAARGTRLAQRSTAGTPEAEPRRQREQRPQPTERSRAEAAPAELAQAADDPALEALAIAPAGARDRRNATEPDGRSSPARRDREPAESTTVVRGAPLVAQSWQTTPTMSLVALPQAARRRIPRSPGFDFAFEMAHGEAPFVNPALDHDLSVDRPPLTVATDGFEALLQNGLGRRPRRQPIRVEEILAAVPPPPTLVNEATGPVRLGLHVAPSGRRIGGMPTLLLEAAVYAAGEAAPAAEASQLTLVIDQSVAGDARVWPRICRGLAAVADRLEPAARVTAVLCGPRPRIAIRDAEPAELIAASTAWERLPPAASADLDAGLRLAAKEAASGRTIVVAHAVTLDRGRTNTVDALGEWHRALAVAGGDTVACTPEANAARFVVIDPAAPGPSGGVEPTFGRTGSDAASIRRELLRQVNSRPSLVARHCQLPMWRGTESSGTGSRRSNPLRSKDILESICTPAKLFEPSTRSSPGRWATRACRKRFSPGGQSRADSGGSRFPITVATSGLRARASRPTSDRCCWPPGSVNSPLVPPTTETAAAF